MNNPTPTTPTPNPTPTLNPTPTPTTPTPNPTPNPNPTTPTQLPIPRPPSFPNTFICMIPSRHISPRRLLAAFAACLAVLSFTTSTTATTAAAENGTTPEPLSLARAIQLSLQSNFSYRIEQASPQIARMAVTEARATFSPELFASADFQQSEQQTTFSTTTGTARDSRSWQIGARQRLHTGTQLTLRANLDRDANNAGVNISNLTQSADASLSLRQPLLRGRNQEVNRAPIEEARAGLRAANQSLRQTVLAVLAQTEEAYWQVALREEILRLQQSSLEVAQALLDEARERQRLGVATRIEVLQAQAAQAEQQEQIITARQQLEDALDELFATMGRLLPATDPAEPPVVTVAALPDQPEEPPPFPDLWREALATDPAIARQQARIDQFQLRSAVARDATRPDLDLVASGAYFGLDDQEASTAVDNLAQGQGYAWSMGIELSIPWGFRGEKAALRSARKQLQQETVRLQQLKQDRYRQLRAAWRDYDSLRQSRAAAALTRDLRQATFQREQSRYEEGIAVFRDVLEARKDLDLARERLLRIRFQQLQSRIRLEELASRLLQRHHINEEILQP